MKPIVLAAALAAVVAPALVAAQGPAAPTAAGLAARVDEMRAELDTLKQAAATADTAAAGLQELDAKLAALAERVEELARGQASLPDARAELDQLAQRVRALEDEQARTLGRVAEVERPGTPVGGFVGEGGVGYEGGFRLATAGGAYSITLSGYAQVRLQVEPSEAFDDVEASSLSLRRARVGLGGNLGGRRLSYKLTFDTVASPAARDYYVDYELVPAATLRLGQYKTQFSRSFVTSSTALTFPDRPQVVERYRYDRDVQIGVHGVALGDRVDYYAGIGNGAGPNATNDNIDLALSGRVQAGVIGAVFKPAEGDLARTHDARLVVGASAVYDLVAMPDSLRGVNNAAGSPVAFDIDVDGDGERDNVGVVSVGVDAAFRWRGLGVEAEWLLRREDWGTILAVNPELRGALDAIGGDGDIRMYQAGYGTVSYVVWPERLLVAARAGAGRLPLLGVSGRSGAVQPGASLVELGGLVQLNDDAFGGRALGLAYEFRDYDARSGADAAADKQHLVMLESQVKF